MLLEFEKNKKNSCKLLVRGIFVSLSTVMLAACANHAKDVASATPVKTESNQVKAYSVIPAAKPLVSHHKKNGVAQQANNVESKKNHEITYLSPSERAYKKVGRASWYGAAFNGRLTANGEIYDMHNLTAAHPTMPLPSYARVTNLENGSSIIVRVNDRGPFAADRVIDLSQQAATMLDYKDDGLADVKVEYVGRAPIEGHDSEFLLASYKPGNITPDTLLAMAGVNLNSPVPENAMQDMTPPNYSGLNNPAMIGVTYPKLPDVGPLPAFKPDNSQLLAFAGETSTDGKAVVFNSILTPSSGNKTSENTSRSTSKVSTKSAKPKATNDMNAAASTMVDDSNSVKVAKVRVNPSANFEQKTDRALEIAWATGVSEAFSIGSER
ncbi:septal ring lytic transglycosylase RlpA family protein [uncultured Bartonella sp.]|uniref:septal ring lytic transglycosylase RlpA family protein n=1 Tax=uncultured Bartonella sp. TaxID=104108 RepID=UPI00345C2A08